MNSFNDTMTDLMLATLDATAAAEGRDEDTLDEAIDDMNTAFNQIPLIERTPLVDAFDRLVFIIKNH